ncbi:MAG: hypothetical protein JWM73_94 [Solirubrobacterales bacterium]|nr:hypothetical protein [Solirubrobacterales bacterium]
MARLERIRKPIGRAARAALGRAGYDLTRREPPADWWPIPPDADDADRATIEATKPYTLTPPERVMGLIAAVRHVVRAGIGGDIAECGVWRGGSMIAVARTLLEEGDRSRTLHLYDTFEYMPEAEDRDVDFNGYPAKDYYPALVPLEAYRYLPFEDVRAALHATGYPAERMRWVKGLVEDTLPDQAPERIALLRLDTDLYRSTRHEMEHLFPRIVDGGVLIVDDYGHFLGARDAVDEYLTGRGIQVLLARMDYSARMAVIRRSPSA